MQKEKTILSGIDVAVKTYEAYLRKLSTLSSTKLDLAYMKVQLLDVC